MKNSTWSLHKVIKRLDKSTAALILSALRVSAALSNFQKPVIWKNGYLVYKPLKNKNHYEKEMD